MVGLLVPGGRAGMYCGDANETALLPQYDSSIGPPRNVSATMDKVHFNTAVLTWKAPAEANSEYIITVRPSSSCFVRTNFTSTSPTTDPVFSVANLDPNVQYNVTVVAVRAARANLPRAYGQSSSSYLLKVAVPTPAAFCGNDSQVNGMSVLSLFIGLMVGTGLGIVMAQVLPAKMAAAQAKKTDGAAAASSPAPAGASASDVETQYKTNPMVGQRGSVKK